MSSDDDWRLGQQEDIAMQVLGDLYYPFTDEMVHRTRPFGIDDLVTWLCRHPEYGAAMRALRGTGIFDDDYWRDGVVEFFDQDPRLSQLEGEKWRATR